MNKVVKRKSGQITDHDRLFNDLSVEICEKYTEVGLELGLDGKVLTNELETGKFMMLQGSKKATKMLQLWRDSVKEEDCTYSVLADALEKHGFQRSAHKYCYIKGNQSEMIALSHAWQVIVLPFRTDYLFPPPPPPPLPIHTHHLYPIYLSYQPFMSILKGVLHLKSVLSSLDTPQWGEGEWDAKME